MNQGIKEVYKALLGNARKEWYLAERNKEGFVLQRDMLDTFFYIAVWFSGLWLGPKLGIKR